MRKFIDRWGLRDPSLDLARAGAPILGTCAGMTIPADEIAGAESPVLPLLDVTVERNVSVARRTRSRRTSTCLPWAS